MSALDWTFAITGGLALYFGLACAVGRFCGGTEDAPVKQTQKPVDWDAHLEVWPTADEAEQAIYDKLFWRRMDVEPAHWFMDGAQ